MKRMLRSSMVLCALGALAVLLWPDTAHAADELDKGDTAWMLTSTVLVLFMTIPGLFLFYGGLVRTKNVLSVLMQCFACACLITILWTVCGYSLAFDDSGMKTEMVTEHGKEVKKPVLNAASVIGGFEKAMLRSTVAVTKDKNTGEETRSFALNGTIPDAVFSMFQLTFAIITPALFVGAFAERMKFSACLLFMGLWSLLVYSPICHMVWGGGSSLIGGHIKAMDFAGGTVVHINAGTAALVACLMIGKRKGYPDAPMKPHNVAFTVIGASMLWVGWFGFNAGSAGAADGKAGMAMLVTQVATGTAGFTWMVVEWIRHGKPSALGIATGAVAGLVAITPASGYVGPLGALVIGVSAGIVCYLFSTTVKRALGYDDSLDVVGVHLVGGIVGCILTGIFYHPRLGGVVWEDTPAMGGQIFAQLLSIVITIVWCGVISFVLLFLIDKVIGLRVSEEVEMQGLDINEHGESGYNEIA